jgi:tRNA-Thr(GGU) m(6)t(6)A37 methyltransferase TsaA
MIEERPQTLSFCLRPIGLIRTPFKRAEGAPIQGVAGSGADGVVEVFTEFVPGLRDVAAFERLWLIYLLDRAAGVQMVVHPYLDAEERGVFATRAPVRPNHLGISVVRLFGVHDGRLSVGDVDMLDDTPLLDIKPYVPAFDAFQNARAGWFEGKSAAHMIADGRFGA